VVPNEEGASSWGTQRIETGGSADVIGGVVLFRAPGQASAKIWIADTATGKESLHITVSIDDADAPSLLAVRVVDLLRASLRDVDLSERAQAETRPAAIAGLSMSNQSPAAPHGFERWAIRAGATTLWETGDLGVGMAVTVGIARRISPRLALELAFMSPVVGQTYAASAATAQVRQELGIVTVAWRLLERRYLTLALSQGVGAAYLSVRGEAQSLSPWLGQSTSAWAAASSTGACLGLRLSDRVGLEISLAAVFLLPRPVLQVADVSYELHQPLILATGGFRYGF